MVFHYILDFRFRILGLSTDWVHRFVNTVRYLLPMDLVLSAHHQWFSSYKYVTAFADPSIRLLSIIFRKSQSKIQIQKSKINIPQFFQFMCTNDSGRQGKAPDNGPGDFLHNRTCRDIAHDRLRWHAGSADEKDNPLACMPDLEPFPVCCIAFAPFFHEWEEMPAAPGCKDVLVLWKYVPGFPVRQWCRHTWHRCGRLLLIRRPDHG